MRFEIGREAIWIFPESAIDEAYIEDTLGLRKHGEAMLLVRKNALGMDRIACLETQRPVEGDHGERRYSTWRSMATSSGGHTDVPPSDL